MSPGTKLVGLLRNPGIHLNELRVSNRPCFFHFHWTLECRSISKCHLFSPCFSSSQLTPNFPKWWTKDIGNDVFFTDLLHAESCCGQIPICQTISPEKKKHHQLTCSPPQSSPKFRAQPQDLQISSHGNHSGTWISWQKNKGRWFRGAKFFFTNFGNKFPSHQPSVEQFLAPET